MAFCSFIRFTAACVLLPQTSGLQQATPEALAALSEEHFLRPRVQNLDAATSLRIKKLSAKASEYTEMHTEIHPLAFYSGKMGAWAPVQQTGTSDSNMCVDGKLLPELYVLGASKCATTSLATDLMGAGIEPIGDDCRTSSLCNGGPPSRPAYKEFHFWETRNSWDNASWSSESFQQQHKKWMTALPPCIGNEDKHVARGVKAYGADAPAPRRVIADFTPENLRMVPMPSDLMPSGKFVLGLLEGHLMKSGVNDAEENPLDDDDDGSLSNDFGIDLPRRLHAFYGNERGRKLQFVVMLRRPIERLQSLFYCCMECQPGKLCPDGAFERFLKPNVDLASQSTDLTIPKLVTDALWGSMYGAHIDSWLRFFEASQLHIVPVKQYSSGGEKKDRLCKQLSKRLNYDMDCNSTGHNATQENVHEHPTPEADAGEEYSRLFEEVMAPEKARLIRVLAKAHVGGAHLAGYTGIKGDTTALLEWLDENW